MLIVMKAGASPAQVRAICEHIERLGLRAEELLATA